MRSPSEHHLWALYGLMLLDGDKVGKTLQRVHCGSLHSKHRSARIFDKLHENLLLIVVGLVFESGERAHANHIAVATHHRNSFEQVFGLIAVHNHAALGFELPRALIHIEHYHIHAQVHGSLLGAETRAQRRVKEYHQKGLVFTQMFICISVGLHFEGFFHRLLQVAKVGYVLKVLHSLNVVKS